MNDTAYGERTCRVCSGDLETILHLGTPYPSRFPLAGEELPPQIPLDFCTCVECRLVQLRHTVDPDAMFRQYWYQSGINETMRAELEDVVAQATARVPLLKGDLVIDVGANDGTLLSFYLDRDLVRVAFEPAQNLQAALRSQADMIIADYFPDSLFDLEVRGAKFDEEVKILTSIAVFYDLDDPDNFVAQVKRLLHPDGVWIVQFQDLDQMLKATAFDNICFEHLIYYSLASFQRLIEPHGLRVTDAEVRSINGGSYRLYVQHKNKTPTANVDALWHQEYGCEEWDTFYKFAWRAQEAKRQISAAIRHLVNTGKIVDLYGASTKGNTLLQWCGLDHRLIRRAIERSPEKIGRVTIGTDIPIVGEEEGRRDPADAWLVGIWQFREHILKREADYLTQGGTLLFPLPKVEIVSEAVVEGYGHGV